jgi:hypothetical protein
LPQIFMLHHRRERARVRSANISVQLAPAQLRNRANLDETAAGVAACPVDDRFDASNGRG